MVWLPWVRPPPGHWSPPLLDFLRHLLRLFQIMQLPCFLLSLRLMLRRQLELIRKSGERRKTFSASFYVLVCVCECVCVLWNILTVLVCIIMFLSVINFILSLYIFLLTQNKILHLGFDYHHNIIINVSEFDSIHRLIAPPCSVNSSHWKKNFWEGTNFQLLGTLGFAFNSSLVIPTLLAELVLWPMPSQCWWTMSK